MEIDALFELYNLRIARKLEIFIDSMGCSCLALNVWRIDDQNSSNLFILIFEILILSDNTDPG